MRNIRFLIFYLGVAWLFCFLIALVACTEESIEEPVTTTQAQIQRLEPIATLPEERNTDENILESVSDNISDVSDVRDNSGITVDDQDNHSELDLWDAGLEWYGISYQDTNRSLRLITYEGYGYSRLSYYVACCCWTRATEGYWGYPNLYAAFGQNDESYWGDWLDGIGIADWAYDALWECYRNPTYCMYCNGVIEPYNYMYAEWSEGDGCMIYCWND